MKIEELAGLKYPFKVRIMKGLGWYENKVGEIFEIFNVDNYRGHPILYPSLLDSIKLDSNTDFINRNNEFYIKVSDCELVKELSYSDLKEAYANLTEDELKQCEFEEYDTDKVIQVMNQYGRVWFKLTQNTWGVPNTKSKYGYCKDIYMPNKLCNIYLPFNELDFVEGLIRHLREDYLVTKNNSIILYPDNPVNKRILENKIDRLSQQEKISQNVTEEIDLFV